MDKSRLKKIISKVLHESSTNMYDFCHTVTCSDIGYKTISDRAKGASLYNTRNNDGTQKYCVTPKFCCYKEKAVGDKCLDENGKECKSCILNKEKVVIPVVNKKEEEERRRRQAAIDAENAVIEKKNKERQAAIAEMNKWNWMGEFSGYSQGYAGQIIEDMQDCINEVLNSLTGGDKITDVYGRWGSSTEEKLRLVLPLLNDTNDLVDRLDKLKSDPSNRRNAFTTLDIWNICLKVSEYKNSKNNTNKQSKDDIGTQKNSEDLIDVQGDEVDYEIKPFIDEKRKIKKRIIKEQTEGADPLYSQTIILKQLLKYTSCLPYWYEVDKETPIVALTKKDGTILRYAITGKKKYPKTGYVTPDESGIPDETVYYVYIEKSILKMMNQTNRKVNDINCSRLDDFRKTVERRDNYIKTLIKFGIKDAPTIEETELLKKVNEVTTKINEMVNDSFYKSDNFINWRTFLNEYYAGNQEILQLTTQQPLTYSEIPEAQKNNYVDISSDIKEKLGWNIKVYKLVNQAEWMDYMAKRGCTPELARKVLTKYLREAIIDTAGAANVAFTNEWGQMRNQIIMCKRAGKYKDDDEYTAKDVLGSDEAGYSTTEENPFKKYGDPMKFSQIADYLSGKESKNLLGFKREYKGKYLIRPNSWIIDKLNESFELKDKIKLTLNETVLEKRKIIQQEKLVRSRVNMLLENSEFKSKTQRRDFIVNLLQESLYLDSQGFNKQIINEEFWDVIKGFFGDDGSQSVFKSFKNKMAEWLVSHLSPKKADGWIGDCIRKTIKEIDMEDVHLITDCKFLTRKISRSIVEKLKQKMTNDELRDEGIYDVVRGGMADNVKSAKFRAHIEQKVERMICPILYDMSNRFDATFEKMKKRTLDIFD